MDKTTADKIATLFSGILEECEGTVRSMRIGDSLHLHMKLGDGNRWIRWTDEEERERVRKAEEYRKALKEERDGNH